MSGTYQQVIICGNLGSDPETRQMQNDQTVTNLSVATTEQWHDKDGNKQERTEWHKVVAFGKLSEIMTQYLSKGDKVLISGQIRTRKWQAQDGTDRYSTEIVAKDMTMLGGRQSDSAPRPARAPAPVKNAATEGAYAPQQDDLVDDDIPF